MIEKNLLAAKILASTISQSFPNAIVLESGIHTLGFYCDCLFEQPLTQPLLEWLEIQVFQYLKKGLPVKTISMMRENAHSFFEHHGQDHLADKVAAQTCNIVDLIQIDNFYDLCPSIPFTSTEQVGAIKLLNFIEIDTFIEGDSTLFTRIIGIQSDFSKELKKKLKNYERYLKKDHHALLGAQLNLFSLTEHGCDLGVMWHPQGIKLKKLLKNWLDEKIKDQVDEIATPMVCLEKDPHQSTEFLNVFEFDGRPFHLRNKANDFHIHFFKTFFKDKTYLPKRLHEWGMFYRNIPDLQRDGLLNACHYEGETTTIFCLKERAIEEIISSLQFIEQMITIFCFDARWVIISRKKGLKERETESYVTKSCDLLTQAFKAQTRLFPHSFERNELLQEIERVELRVKDPIEREWTLSKISILTSFSIEGQLLVVLTRQIWESLDRLIALYLENNQGGLPFWMAPEQVRVFVIGEDNCSYAMEVVSRLIERGVRATLDQGAAKLSLRVHEAEKQLIPYLIIIGEQERKKGTISVRAKNKHNRSFDIETFLETLGERKSLES